MILARGRFYGRALLNALVLLPLVLPPVVTGYVLLLLFGRQGPIGRWLDQTFGIVFAFRWTGAALACAIMGFPLMVRAIQLSAAAVDRKLEQAAGTLGANPAYVFLTVTLPLMAPGIIAGAILSFARSMGEFGATITFVSNIPGETQTLPTLIYTFTQVPGGDAGALRLTADLARHLALGDPRVGMDRAGGQPQGEGLTPEAKSKKPETGVSGFQISGFLVSGYGVTATPQGKRPTGTDFSALCNSTSITVKSLVRPLAT